MAYLRRPLLAVAGTLAIFLAFALATVQTTPEVRADDPVSGNGETLEISAELRNPDKPTLVGEDSVAPSFSIQAAEGEAQVGDQKTWVALHDVGGYYYTKTFQLLAEDDVGEVWVAVGQGRDPDGVPDGILGLNFPAGDCRNDGVRNVVTTEQAQYLLGQFTNNIKGIDEAWFGAPDARFGADGILPRPSPGGKQVILIDNVRDDNFYDTNNTNSLPYIAGFFTSAMIDFHDRNVMTIDGFDWLHRTTIDPPHSPSSNPCLNAPARPALYEGVFAHEYQHLIHNDYDPDELSWVNEGMSDLAIFLTGYSDPSLRVDEKGNDSHVMAFQGWSSVQHPDWNPIPRQNGPENSLTLWEDQGPTEVLEDYGIAYMFMQYLYDHGYGQAFFTAWHHNTLNGIEGFNDTLASFGADDADDDSGHGSHGGHGNNQQPATFESLFEDFRVMVLVDAYLDKGAKLKGDERDRDALSSDSLNSTLFLSPEAYASLGAPPWGSDYIPIGKGKNLNSLKFDGDDIFVFPGGNDWTVDPDGYMTQPDEEGEVVYPNGLDSSIAREVTVPAAPATLTFEQWYQTEFGWDYGFVQVLDGDEYVSLPCSGTTTEANPGADPSISAQLPGYTGPTEDPSDPATAGTPAAPLAVTCDLSAYAGQTIVLAFRFMSDTAVQFDGWHIRNVAVNGTPLDATPADISDWDNEGFFVPVNLGFDVQIVGISGKVNQYGQVTKASEIQVVRPNIGPGFKFTLSNSDRNALKKSDLVVVIVTGIPADETQDLYFPYSLKVNGQERADGAGLP